jgi:Uma2 family endonuclease
MATLASPELDTGTLADLVERLGDIPLRRIRSVPAPGTATEQDLLEIHRRTNRLYELVEGVLVEKAMGFRESCLAGAMLAILRAFVKPNGLGLVAGADGMMRLASGLVRIPDVSFISWDRIPGRRMPRQPIPKLAPNLAIEVLSEGNTAKEMRRKCTEYFASGARLVWLVDPTARTVTVFTGLGKSVVITEEQTLTGGDVFPGFALPLRNLFAELDERGAR